MASFTVNVLLKEAAELKIDEFDRSKQAFRTRYGIGVPRPVGGSLREGVTALLEDIQKLDSFLENDDDLVIIARYLQQACDDTSISEPKLLKYEKQLLNKLEKHLNRYDITSAQMKLMMEAIEVSQDTSSVAAKLDAVSFVDDFEVVENELEDTLEQFESETFTARTVDVEALETYLASLVDQNGNTKALNTLREDMDLFGKDFLAGDVTIGQDGLLWCITDLLKNPLISDEKKKALESYIQSPIAIKELLATLNMKSIQHWNFRNADKGQHVTARQDSEGQYHIVVEEELVDMLFLHCTAILWAQKLKESLVDFFRDFKSSATRALAPEEEKAREFFLEQMPHEHTQVQCSNCQMFSAPMPCPPPPPPPIWRGVRVKKGKGAKTRYPPPPPPHHMMMTPPPPHPTFLISLDAERRRRYLRDFFMARLPNEEGCRPSVAPAEQVQANLIKTLFAEMKVRSALDEKLGYSTTSFQSVASSLPHQTVLTILKFIGVPGIWMEVFERFLAAKLNIGPAVRGAPDRTPVRACGVPTGHGMELLFTEAVMFFAELAVHKETGMYLYRSGSDCYFVGTEEQRDQTYLQLRLFSERTGLEIDEVAMQEAFSIGFVYVEDELTIRDSLVEVHAWSIKGRLSKCKSVYDWVRVWNSTVGTYAAHLFGPLAELFGASHLNAVKTAYKNIFNIVLEDNTLTEHVAKLLRVRLGSSIVDIPTALEPFIYLPQAFGGLGVKNPFSTLSIARNMGSDSNATIQKYFDAETRYYEAAKTNWSSLKRSDVAKKLSALFNNDKDSIKASLGPLPDHPFPSKEDLTKHREYVLFPALPFSLLRDAPPPPFGTELTPCPWLTGLYRSLINEPIDDITPAERVSDDVRRLSGRGGMKRWNKLSPEDKWVLQLYGDECFERYGTLEMWFGEDVPSFCLSVVRAEVWNDDADSESSYPSVA